MPPPDSHLERLSPEEQQLVRDWIDAGAVYEKHWAFTSLQRPVAKDDPTDLSNENPIDQLVRDQLEEQGLTAAPQADVRTLIRRVTLDLTGLPPTRDEIQDFVDQFKSSPETAWEQLVDRLLAKPQYGEHQARYWLDLVRFADTNGMHKDFYRNHVAYRDWVIRAFNENLGYDDFLTWQLAGDLFANPKKDQLIASGFHRLHLIIDRGTALPEESHVKNVLDRVSSVGTAFLGLTVQCAQCHDHKYDPISQREFYSLYAFFNNLDAAPETAGRPVDGLQEPVVRWPTPEQSASLKVLGIERKFLSAESKQLAQELKDAQGQATPPSVLIQALDARIAELGRRATAANTRWRRLNSSVESAMVMRERDDPRPTHVLVRGQYDAPGALVERGTPTFLPELKRDSDVASRMDLAEWFVASENPLTARVAVNRFWQSLFGVGLVKTSEDFGSQGTPPSHPRLLDELALGFVESGWDVKALLKRIVMSQTYRQASRVPAEQFRVDPENRLLGRGPRYRLDAEVIRDQILATSGLLSPRMFGPSVKPPQPDGLWFSVSMIGERFRPDDGEATRRRSLYTFWKRALPPPQMTILNAPLRDSCIARRERTNTATQALLLLNEKEYLKAARQLAHHALSVPTDQRLRYVWETVTSRIPDAMEEQLLGELLEEMRTKYSSDAELASALCEGVDCESAADRAELAAWTIVCSTVYNLDITKTKD